MHQQHIWTNLNQLCFIFLLGVIGLVIIIAIGIVIYKKFKNKKTESETKPESNSAPKLK